MTTQQIFKATYSGIAVFEMMVKGVAVMRRRSDSYLNATQILKVADFDKPQRTRILDREVQTGEHEKVQGGYGKYQGTWVPLDRAISLAERYNVKHLLQPMFEFIQGDDSPPLAPKHVTAVSARPRRTREGRTRKNPSVSAPHENVCQQPSLRTPSPSTGSETKEDLTPKPKRMKRDTSDEATTGHHATYADQLIDYFMSETAELPLFLPPHFDMNKAIDEEGHTSLHWAAALGHVETARWLLNQGADISRSNYKGQTALMRSILFTNNYAKKSFKKLVGLLKSTVFQVDKRKQTIFHHIALTASGKAKHHASRYYLECLIEQWEEEEAEPEFIALLNAKDIYGDTALNLAFRNGNEMMASLLIEAGAKQDSSDDQRTSVFQGPWQPRSSGDKRAIPREELASQADAAYKLLMSETRPPSAIMHVLDVFAETYERELIDNRQLMHEKRKQLASARKRLETIERGLEDVQIAPQLLTDLESRKHTLENHLRKMMQYTQKQKLSQLIQEYEASLNLHSVQSLSIHSPLEHTVLELRERLGQLQHARRALVDEIIRIQSQLPGKRYQAYKWLISMCCDVGYENVDAMLTPLLSTMEQSSPVPGG
ncbi:uncharacterized protein BYT42DRAFT_565148 [Radiomyces spectabilis]|uniref:uncharacterized protein n=1 Tax=Radiomyces spectabilis TaxID=64574 RepID=UPI00221E7EBF|nr:uncharacterized protein BYT42DRAFT_565148 [Radiomyces spectabilis]KAI8381074.1 hypothetical protein BYT42DRAFT_565148 [Radiomyces spectabilis]